MSKLHAWIVLIALGSGTLAHAGGSDRFHHRDTYQDWARVVHVQPEYKRVNLPRQACRPGYGHGDRYGYVDYGYSDSRREDRGLSGVVIGGVAGGLLGNQIGKGNGQVAATAVGAVVGAMVGDRIEHGSARSPHRPPQARERCERIDHWEDRLAGYQVTYEYNGRRYTRFMSERPGRRIRVNVSVHPG